MKVEEFNVLGLEGSDVVQVTMKDGTEEIIQLERAIFTWASQKQSITSQKKLSRQHLHQLLFKQRQIIQLGVESR